MILLASHMKKTNFVNCGREFYSKKAKGYRHQDCPFLPTVKLCKRKSLPKGNWSRGNFLGTLGKWSRLSQQNTCPIPADKFACCSIKRCPSFNWKWKKGFIWESGTTATNFVLIFIVCFSLLNEHFIEGYLINFDKYIQGLKSQHYIKFIIEMWKFSYSFEIESPNGYRSNVQILSV